MGTRYSRRQLKDFSRSSSKGEYCQLQLRNGYDANHTINPSAVCPICNVLMMCNSLAAEQRHLYPL